jgi:hypothetical protein
MIYFNQFINENINESFKFTEEQVLDVANLVAAAISKIDKKTAKVHDLEFDKGRGAGFEISLDDEEFAGGSYSVRPNGEVVNDAIGNSFPNAVYAKIGDSDIKKVMKNIQQFESAVTEAKGFKNTKDFEDFLEEIDGMGEAQIKKIMGKDYIDTPGFYQDEKDEYEDIIDFMISNMGRKEFEKLQDWWENNVQESVVTEAKKFYTTKEIVKLAQAAGDFVLDAKNAIQDLSVAYGDKVPAKELDKVLTNYDLEIEDLMESINEGRKVTLKRRYTENYPAVTAGKAARIRNKVLEFIKDGRITAEAFENFVAGLSNNSKRWTKNNSKYFTISEEGVSLSKFGQKILKGITVNEGKVSEDEIDTVYIEGTFKDGGEFYEDQETTDIEWVKKNYRKITKDLKSSEIFVRMNNGDEITYSEYKKQVNEATTKNPEIWVPGGFDKAITKLPNSQITRDVVLKVAKKFKVNPDDAIAYVEYGWMLDLQENNNTNNMKTQFIYESFSEFVNSLNESTEILNEAFASTKLASILTGANKMDKDLPKAFYQMAKIALDKIQDVDIIEMDPATAKKEKRANAIYMYFTTNAKENPYAGSETWSGEREIPGNTLLAITNGSNEWMATEWQRSYSRSKKGTTVLKTTKRDASAGFPKSKSRAKYGSGISSMKHVAELADRAYCLDLDILRARYSTTAQRDERAAAKKGAIAFQNDKDFKQENLNRYNTIIANRAAAMPIDKMVADAIDTLSSQIKDALTKGEKTQYNEILLGKSSRGREAKLQDAANHMQRILDDFQRYVSYTNQAEEEKKAGYGGDYYAREVKNYAKSITDRIKQIETFGYAW